MAVVGDQFDDCNPVSFGGFGGATSGASDAASWRTVGDSGNGSGNGSGSQASGNDPEICGESMNSCILLDDAYLWRQDAR